MIMSVKEEYQSKVQKLVEQQIQAEEKEQEANSLKSNIQATIQEEADKISRDSRERLETEYKAMKAGYEGLMLGSLLYGVLCTILTACSSKAFISDFKAFFWVIGSFVSMGIEQVLEWAKWASQLGDMIPQQTVAFIVHWIIVGAVVLIIGFVVAVILSIAGSHVYEKYREEYADLISLSVALISLAVVVFFAEQIRAVVPINLLLLLILVHMLYMGVRWCIKGWRKKRWYY